MLKDDDLSPEPTTPDDPPDDPRASEPAAPHKTDYDAITAARRTERIRAGGEEQPPVLPGRHQPVTRLRSGRPTEPPIRPSPAIAAGQVETRSVGTAAMPSDPSRATLSGSRSTLPAHSGLARSGLEGSPIRPRERRATAGEPPATAGEPHLSSKEAAPLPDTSERELQAQRRRRLRNAAAAAGVSLALALMLVIWSRGPSSHHVHESAAAAVSPSVASRPDPGASANLAAAPAPSRLHGDQTPSRELAAPAPPQPLAPGAAASSRTPPGAAASPEPPQGTTAPPWPPQGATASGETGGRGKGARSLTAPPALSLGPRSTEPAAIPDESRDTFSSPATSSGSPATTAEAPDSSAGVPEPPPAPPAVWMRPRTAPPGSDWATEPPPTDVESPPPPRADATTGSGRTGDGAEAGDLSGGAEPSRETQAAAPRPLWRSQPATTAPAPARAMADITGSWEVHNVIDSTSHPSYRGLRLTYHVTLRREGARVVGRGEKWAENDRRIPAAQRTPIELTGEMVGRELRVQFTEEGSRRESAGSFRWRLSPDGRSLAGTFASDAAGSRGVSAAYRLP